MLSARYNVPVYTRVKSSDSQLNTVYAHRDLAISLAEILPKPRVPRAQHKVDISAAVEPT